MPNDLPEIPLPATLAEAEARIRFQPFETAFVFDRESGACLVARDGELSRVDLLDVTSEVRDNIVLHNHPKGNNISEYDMQFIAYAKLAEFRIVTTNRRLCRTSLFTEFMNRRTDAL